VILSEVFKYFTNGDLYVIIKLDTGCTLVLHNRFLNEIEKAKLLDRYIRHSLSEVTKKEIM
jgi:hypothetical protein